MLLDDNAPVEKQPPKGKRTIKEPCLITICDILSALRKILLK